MACNNYVKNGPHSSERFIRSSRVEYELGIGVTRALRMDFTPSLSGTPAVDAPHISVEPLHPSYNSKYTSLNEHPFMNTMDEISYWIYTKRAPCLMNYDNKIKNQSEELQSSKTKPKSVPSVAKVPSPAKKKKKRKLSLLDDNSSSTSKQRHVYFDSSQNVKQTVVRNCKFDSLGSDIDFNLKTFSAPGKRKKLQKNSKTTVHKKSKIITSTPKVLPLRRSLRKAQQNLKKNSQLDTFEVCNASVINGHNARHALVEEKLPHKIKKSSQLLASGDQCINNKKKATASIGKPKNNVLNGQFEEYSDVSGFTANYIRSTKLQSTKATKKSRLKNSRNLIKDPQHNEQRDTTTVLHVNKSVNTADKSAAQNCSTDSENVINLVTTQANDKAGAASKSTSLLKFMESKVRNEICGIKTKRALNVSFETKSNTSRYPKRYRNSSKTQENEIQERHKTNNREKGKKINNPDEINSSDRKEISETAVVSKTRSGRNIGLPPCPPENSVVVLSNSTEQVSSTVSMNVASAVVDSKERKKKRITRHSRSLKAHVNVQRDSLREKSGFSACFSDSDDDSEPLKQRKYFRA